MRESERERETNITIIIITKTTTITIYFTVNKFCRSSAAVPFFIFSSKWDGNFMFCTCLCVCVFCYTNYKRTAKYPLMVNTSTTTTTKYVVWIQSAYSRVDHALQKWHLHYRFIYLYYTLYLCNKLQMIRCACSFMQCVYIHI